MSQRIGFFEASDIIKELGTHTSADYYRMSVAGPSDLCLGLRDKPMYILADVVLHGSSEAKAMLQHALECGYVKEVEGPNGYTFHDVIDVENVAGAPYQFMSHIAMQIAFPERYHEYFGGELVWNYSHPKMQELIPLCISCLTNMLHPSDWWGHHLIADEKRKPGRPKKEGVAEVKKVSTGHGDWVAACQAHNQAISEAWAGYLEACTKRASAKSQGAIWLQNEVSKIRRDRDAKIQDLERQIAEIREQSGNSIRVCETQYQMELDRLNNEVANALQAHKDIKNLPKPMRADFV